MRRTTYLWTIAAFLWITACRDGGTDHPTLPFPTPAQHELVVLVRPGLLTYQTDDGGSPSGLEHDLIQAFAEELGVDVRYVVAEGEAFSRHLERGGYHLAAAWLSPPGSPQIESSPPIFQTHDVVLQHEASLPLTEVGDLGGRTVHAMADTRQAHTALALKKRISGLNVVPVGADTTLLDLAERLGSRKIELAIIDQTLEDVAYQHVPSLRASLPLGEPQPVVWLLGPRPNVELKARISRFVERVQHDGTLARLEDRHLGHRRRLTQADIRKFLAEIETTLPKYRRYFQAAQSLTGLDWRLIAAVAYHESHWDPNATSYTNVRGIMMLTEETADRLQVGNRLDPAESILAGARYITLLKDQLPEDVEEPDRTWLALAAYNIGPGNLNVAQTLAKKLKADPGNWYEMKRLLPKLGQTSPEQAAKSGRIRGGEAVILVENIRSYYDILQRNAAPLAPGLASSDGLKHLVLEVEQKRKAYVRKMAAARAIANGEDTESEPPRLPTIPPEPDSRTATGSKPALPLD